MKKTSPDASNNIRLPIPCKKSSFSFSEAVLNHLNTVGAIGVLMAVALSDANAAKNILLASTILSATSAAGSTLRNLIFTDIGNKGHAVKDYVSAVNNGLVTAGAVISLSNFGKEDSTSEVRGLVGPVVSAIGGISSLVYTFCRDRRKAPHEKRHAEKASLLADAADKTSGLAGVAAPGLSTASKVISSLPSNTPAVVLGSVAFASIVTSIFVSSMYYLKGMRFARQESYDEAVKRTYPVAFDDGRNSREMETLIRHDKKGKAHILRITRDDACLPDAILKHPPKLKRSQSFSFTEMVRASGDHERLKRMAMFLPKNTDHHIIDIHR